MGANAIDEIRRQLPQQVLDRRADIAKLLEDAVASGDKKFAGEYRKLLRECDKTIAEYGFKRHA